MVEDVKSITAQLQSELLSKLKCLEQRQIELILEGSPQIRVPAHVPEWLGHVSRGRPAAVDWKTIGSGRRRLIHTAEDTAGRQSRYNIYDSRLKGRIAWNGETTPVITHKDVTDAARYLGED